MVSTRGQWPGETPDVSGVESEVEDAENEAAGAYDDEPGDEDDEAALPDVQDEAAVSEPEDAAVVEDDDVEDTGEGVPDLAVVGRGDGELDIPEDVDVLEGEPRSTRRAVGLVVSRTEVDVANRLLESTAPASAASTCS
jgi:hypothetical protein